MEKLITMAYDRDLGQVLVFDAKTDELIHRQPVLQDLDGEEVAVTTAMREAVSRAGWEL